MILPAVTGGRGQQTQTAQGAGLHCTRLYGATGEGGGRQLRERDCGEVVPETLQYCGIINLQVLRQLTDGKECSVPHDLLFVTHS